MEERYLDFMFYGLSAAWLILLGYVVLLVSRDGKTRRELDNLKRMISEKERH